MMPVGTITSARLGRRNYTVVCEALADRVRDNPWLRLNAAGATD